MDTRTHAYHTTLLSRLFWREKGLGDKKKKTYAGRGSGKTLGWLISGMHFYKWD